MSISVLPPTVKGLVTSTAHQITGLCRHEAAIDPLLSALKTALLSGENVLPVVNLICLTLRDPKMAISTPGMILGDPLSDLYSSDYKDSFPADQKRVNVFTLKLNKPYEEKRFILNLANILERAIGTDGRSPVPELGELLHLFDKSHAPGDSFQKLKEFIKGAREMCLPDSLRSIEPVSFARQIVATTHNNSGGGVFGGVTTRQYVEFMDCFYKSLKPADHVDSRGEVQQDYELTVLDNDVNALERLRVLLAPTREIRKSHNESVDKEAMKKDTSSSLQKTYRDVIGSDLFSELVKDVTSYIERESSYANPSYLSLAIEGMFLNGASALVSEGHGFVASFYRGEPHDGVRYWMVIDNVGAGSFGVSAQEPGKVRSSIHGLGVKLSEFIEDLFKIQANISNSFRSNMSDYESLIKKSELNPRPALPNSISILEHKWLYKKQMRDGSCVSKAYDAAYKGRTAVRLFNDLLYLDLPREDAVNFSIQLTFLCNRARKQHRDVFLYSLGSMDEWSRSEQTSRSAIVGVGYTTISDNLEKKISNRYRTIHNSLCNNVEPYQFELWKIVAAIDVKPFFEVSHPLGSIVDRLHNVFDKEESWGAKSCKSLISSVEVKEEVPSSCCVIM